MRFQGYIAFQFRIFISVQCYVILMTGRIISWHSCYTFICWAQKNLSNFHFRNSHGIFSFRSDKNFCTLSMKVKKNIIMEEMIASLEMCGRHDSVFLTEFTKSFGICSVPLLLRTRADIHSICFIKNVYKELLLVSM